MQLFGFNPNSPKMPLKLHWHSLGRVKWFHKAGTWFMAHVNPVTGRNLHMAVLEITGWKKRLESTGKGKRMQQTGYYCSILIRLWWLLKPLNEKLMMLSHCVFNERPNCKIAWYLFLYNWHFKTTVCNYVLGRGLYLSKYIKWVLCCCHVIHGRSSQLK